LLANYQSSDSEQDDNTGGNGEDDVDGSDSDAELAKPNSIPNSIPSPFTQ
jgi:hypothetical protein